MTQNVTVAEMTPGIPELVALMTEAERMQGNELDNTGRAALIAEVLCLFAMRTGQARSGDPVETIMVDLLTNLMHLCDDMDIGFNGILTVAVMHHADECGS